MRTISAAASSSRNVATSISTSDTTTTSTSTSSVGDASIKTRKTATPKPTGLFHFTDKDCVYEGQMYDNQRHGHGTLTHSNGYIFQGEFLNGMMSGYGKWSHPRGEYLEGFYSNGQLNGQGSRLVNGESYEGEFLNSVPHGYGVSRNSNGKSYEGDFEHGLYHGYGTLKFFNGTEYSGEFHKGAKHGTGVLTYSSGTKYEGGFERNLRSGAGKITYPNGNTLTGNFVADSIKTGSYTYSHDCEDKNLAGVVVPWEAKMGKKEKKAMKEQREKAQVNEAVSSNSAPATATTTVATNAAADAAALYRSIVADPYPGIVTAFTRLPLRSVSVTFPDGIYSGEVSGVNIRSGYGIMVYQDGSVYAGKWLKDQPYGNGRMSYWSSNGLSGLYTGRWEEGKYHGLGLHYTYLVDSEDAALKTKIVYDGAFERGLRHGQGVLKEKESRYEGEFVNGEKHGQGVLHYRVLSGAKLLQPFVGTFARNLPYTGSGAVIRPTGIFEGKIVEGKEEGPGKFTSFKDQSVIEGEWVNGEITMGKLFYETGMY